MVVDTTGSIDATPGSSEGMDSGTHVSISSGSEVFVDAAAYAHNTNSPQRSLASSSLSPKGKTQAISKPNAHCPTTSTSQIKSDANDATTSQRAQLWKPWIKLVLTLQGRDKATKVLQYGSRLLAWWFAAMDHQHRSKRLMLLYKSLSTSRKAFRLGLGFVELEKLCAGKTMLRFNPKDTSDAATSKQHTPIQPVPRDDMDVVGTVLSTLKAIGMIMFLTGDNLNFLYSSSLFDNFRLAPKYQQQRRSYWQQMVGCKANQAYFYSCLMGLILNWRLYRRHQMETLQAASFVADADEEGRKQCHGDAGTAAAKRQEKRMSLILNLVKSACDVIVFSNNPGVDLHQKLRGRKNHEAIHSICGVISASTVLYKSFPKRV